MNNKIMNSLEFLVLVLLCFARVREREILSESKLCHSSEESEAMHQQSHQDSTCCLFNVECSSMKTTICAHLFSNRTKIYSIPTFPHTIQCTTCRCITKCDLESQIYIAIEV